MKIFIIHGCEGHPEENWFPWLGKQLKGHEVIVPQFPTPDGQTLKAWREVFDKYMKDIDGSILVGHSAGCAFILDILQRTDKKVRAAILVAGFASLLGSKFDDLIETFVDRDFDWEKIRKSAGRISLYNSDNDSYVPQELGVEIASHVGGQITIVHGAGHFNTPAGYDKFPLLLDDIKHHL